MCRVASPALSLCLKCEPVAGVCAFQFKGRPEFLPGYLQTALCVCVCVAPPSQHRSGHIPLSAALDNNRKRRGNPRAHFLCVQPAFFTMEQEEPGNCKRVLGKRVGRGRGSGDVTECKGKIKLSFHPQNVLSFPAPPLKLLLFPSLRVTQSKVVYLLKKHTLFPQELFFFFFL